MAAVTVNSKRYNMIGSRRQRIFNVTGNNTNTLATGLNTIDHVNVQLTTTNPPTNVAVSGGTITFSSGGAFTTSVEVIGA